MPEFVHLHCHTQYSLLDGASSVKDMLSKASQNGMPGVAITDHGNMFGAFDFYLNAKKHDITPIIGCEFYLVEDRFIQKFDKSNRDKRFHQLMLAKTPEGYKNLSKLCSLGFIEGYYSKFPRIDKELVRKYKEGLIATTCCVAAEVPQTLLYKGEEEAEKVFLEWLDLFGEDYYIELQRHGLKGIDQEKVNRFLIKMSEKHQVKMIATNDSHYVEQEDWNAHDILLCVNTGDQKSNPVGDAESGVFRFVTEDGKFTNTTINNIPPEFRQNQIVRDAIEKIHSKGFKPRFGFENDQFYFKTGEEMANLFKDVPSAIENTLEVYEKIQPPELKRDILLPHFPLPEGFKTMDDYLRHLTFEGARVRYGEISEDIRERLDHELKIIRSMGFPGYFLIVQDFIAAARKMNVAVGPGRGSAAGSAVAYCIGITNIDPIRYNLLFERFLNPERISMPDIDIDFDDDGRQRVIDYVVKKYGKNQVAQIITYGTMAAKSAIRDVCRVMEYPLPDTDRLAKMVPENPGMTLKKAFDENPDLKEIRNDEKSIEGKLLKLAERLEGSIRNRGIHAAGVIIAPDDLTNYIPICSSKDSDLYVTQFDGKVVEDAGMLKMDFLGLKTLTITKDAINLIQKTTGDEIDIEKIPLEDQKTFKLYQKGETIGTFQFESEGMRAYLKQLKPSNIEDLIAMNALYRPGPMDFIPLFIKRKHGKEKVDYPHEKLEGILKTTYGIMVYQEQIMQAAQIIGGFSLGKADILRRAMGKKKMDVMQQMKGEFVSGAAKIDIPEDKADEIFTIMEKFAAYGFNRSHSAAYSVVAYHTAFLKANYPAQYMAAVLGHNMQDIKKVIFFIEEAKRMGLKVLGPDVNESAFKFNVNEKNEIRFGLGAIKGVGESAVRAIVEERDLNGPFMDIFDLTKRVNLRAVNKKAIENLASAGAFECFDRIHRARYFHTDNGEPNCIEQAVKFGQKSKELDASSQQSLFGDSGGFELTPPKIPDCEEWPLIETLKKEKELIGFYVSGHPLDDFRFEIAKLCIPFEQDSLKKHFNQDVRIAGIITTKIEKRDKKGRKFGIFGIEGLEGSIELMLFSEDYLKMQHLIEAGNAVFVEGKVEKKFNKDDEFTIRPKDIKYLADLRERIKKVRLIMDLNEINSDSAGELEKIFSENPGPCLLEVQVKDDEDNLEIEMPSGSFKIEPSDNFFKNLNDFSEVKDYNLYLN